MQRVFAENVVHGGARWCKGDAERAVKETKRLSAGKTGTPKKQTAQATEKQRSKQRRREAEKQTKKQTDTEANRAIRH